MKFKRLIPYFIAMFATVPQAVSAKVNLDKYHQEITEMAVDENLQTPAVPSKFVIGAQSAMAGFATRLQRSGYEVDLSERDGMVLMVTVPASELFAPNDTIISHSAPQKLKPLAQPLRVPDKYKLLVVVHSDDTGSEEYLYDLTRARADAIRNWIAGQGIPVDGVVPYGLGYDEPVSVEVSRKGRAANRRVEFYYVPGPIMLEELKAGRR